jgi:hypothetical protein
VRNSKATDWLGSGYDARTIDDMICQPLRGNSDSDGDVDAVGLR